MGFLHCELSVRFEPKSFVFSIMVKRRAPKHAGYLKRLVLLAQEFVNPNFKKGSLVQLKSKFPDETIVINDY